MSHKGLIYDVTRKDNMGHLDFSHVEIPNVLGIEEIRFKDNAGKKRFDKVFFELIQKAEFLDFCMHLDPKLREQFESYQRGEIEEAKNWRYLEAKKKISIGMRKPTRERREQTKRRASEAKEG